MQASALAVGPREQRLSYEEWPECPAGGFELQFHLLYQGRLPAQSDRNSRKKDKHSIRQFLHPQLKELWRTQPFLRRYMTMLVDPSQHTPDQKVPIPYVESVGNKHPRYNGYRFVPLVGSGFGPSDEPKSLACALDILFLRTDQPPGDLVKSGGDIDNRIKVLFDALKIPADSDGLDIPPSEDEDPFFCLLEDDSLITEVRIKTDRLLLPTDVKPTEHPEQQVYLVIRVKTLVLGSSGFTAFMT